MQSVDELVRVRLRTVLLGVERQIYVLDLGMMILVVSRRVGRLLGIARAVEVVEAAVRKHGRARVYARCWRFHEMLLV